MYKIILFTCQANPQALSEQIFINDPSYLLLSTDTNYR